MTEKEQKKMRIALKKYEKSDEWKLVQDKCRNKDENIRQKVLSSEDTEYRYTAKYSTDDIELAKAKVFEEIQEMISEVAFSDLFWDLANMRRDNTMLSHLTQFGYSPCEIKFTEKDLDVVKAGEYRLMHQENNRLTALIGSLEKQKEKKVEQVYD